MIKNVSPVKKKKRSLRILIYTQNDEATTLVYKNINSLFYYNRSQTCCLREREREREREGGYDLYQVERNIFRALLLCDSFIGD